MRIRRMNRIYANVWPTGYDRRPRFNLIPEPKPVAWRLVHRAMTQEANNRIVWLSDWDEIDVMYRQVTDLYVERLLEAGATRWQVIRLLDEGMRQERVEGKP